MGVDYVMSLVRRGQADGEIRKAIVTLYAASQWRPSPPELHQAAGTTSRRVARIRKAMEAAGELPALPTRIGRPEAIAKRKATMRRRAHLTSRHEGRRPARQDEISESPHRRLVVEHMARERRIGI